MIPRFRLIGKVQQASLDDERYTRVGSWTVEYANFVGHLSFFEKSRAARLVDRLLVLWSLVASVRPGSIQILRSAL